MDKKVNKNKINLNDIYVGHVALVKECEPGDNTVVIIGRNTNGEIGKIALRKVVFIMRENDGIVLSRNTLNSHSYSYKVIDSSDDSSKLNVKNNTLVIDNPKPIGDILRLIGYPKVVTKKQTKEIAKLVLSKKTFLNTRKNSLILNGNDLYDVEQLIRFNEQSKELYRFKVTNLPVDTQKTEKVYAKYFKK